MTNIETTASTGLYLHGTDPAERARLDLMNGILNAGSLAALGLRRGERIADFGCGLAQLARAMARVAGRGRVVGIERSGEQIAAARALASAAGEEGLVDLRPGDVLAPPFSPEERGAFDVAHARFLLEHVRDPLAVVRVMAGAVRRGGRVVLEDDDHDRLRLDPEPAGFAALWAAYVRAFEVLGNDPRVGRRLEPLLREAGATSTRVARLPFGARAGDAAFPAIVANLAAVIGGARGAVLGAGLLDARAFDAAIAALEKFEAIPGAVVDYSVEWAEGLF